MPLILHLGTTIGLERSGSYYPSEAFQIPDPFRFGYSGPTKGWVCLLLAESFTRMATHQKNAWSTSPSSMGMCCSPFWLSSGPCPHWALTMLNQAVRYVVNGMWLRVEGKASENKQTSNQQTMRRYGSEKLSYVTKIPPAELQIFTSGLEKNAVPIFFFFWYH